MKFVKEKRKMKPPKGEVLLTGLDKDRQVVIEERISVFDYYDSLHAILDDDCIYRKERGIRYVNGIIYNYEGILDQEFINTYDGDGAYVRTQIRFADGTVSES